MNLLGSPVGLSHITRLLENKSVVTQVRSVCVAVNSEKIDANAFAVTA